MTPEAIAINALTARTTELLDVTLAVQAGVSQQIADAVAVSTNAAIIPMMTLTRNQIDLSALVITLITQG